eukprot:SAG31_NODE_7187_length_1762_cov_1.438966_1_plen_41_part_10
MQARANELGAAAAIKVAESVSFKEKSKALLEDASRHMAAAR